MSLTHLIRTLLEQNACLQVLTAEGGTAGPVIAAQLQETVADLVIKLEDTDDDDTYSGWSPAVTAATVPPTGVESERLIAELDENAASFSLAETGYWRYGFLQSTPELTAWTNATVNRALLAVIESSKANGDSVMDARATMGVNTLTFGFWLGR